MNALLISLPVFFLVALGFLLRRRAFFSHEFVSGANSFVYRVALPALIVSSLAGGLPPLAGAKWIILVFYAATIAVQVLAWGYSKWAGHDGLRAATFVQAAYRGNLAFIGLPVLTSAIGDSPESNAFLATAVLVFAPIMILYNVCAVLLFHFLPAKRGSSLRALGAVSSNPLILAAIVGLLVGAFLSPIPVFAARTLDLLGSTAAPLALLCIGAAVADSLGDLRIGDSLAASIFKIAITPLTAYALGRGIGLEQEGMRILLVFAACPTAAASFVFAREMGGDTTLASNSVVLSTLLSPIALTVVLALFF